MLRTRVQELEEQQQPLLQTIQQKLELAERVQAENKKLQAENEQLKQKLAEYEKHAAQTPINGAVVARKRAAAN